MKTLPGEFRHERRGHLRWSALVFFVGLPLASIGCGDGCGGGSGSMVAPNDPEPEVTSGPRGTVRGVVRLAEGASLPSYTEEQVGRADLIVPRPEECPPAGPMDLHPMRLGTGREVSNVSVSATGVPEAFRPFAAGDPEPVEMTIRDCRLTPALVVARLGDQLLVRNTDEHPFLVQLVGESFQQALARGQTRVIEMDRPGVRAVHCSFGAECNRAEVVVLSHRAADVTNDEGRFEFEIPAGTPVTLHAWHPLLGRDEASTEVTVEPGGTVDVEITIQPSVERPEPPPTEPTGSVDEFH